MQVFPAAVTRRFRDVEPGSWFHASIMSTVSLCLKVFELASDGARHQHAVPFGPILPDGMSEPSLIHLPEELAVLDLGADLVVELVLSAAVFMGDPKRVPRRRPGVVMVGERRFLVVSRARIMDEFVPGFAEIGSGELHHKLPEGPHATALYWDLRPIRPQGLATVKAEAIYSERGGVS